MTEKPVPKQVQNLIDLYKLDVEDYDKLLEKMKSFQEFLELETEKMQIEDFEKNLQGFCDFRNNCFQSLQQRAQQTAKLKSQLTSKSGPGFKIIDLKPYLPEHSFLELIELSEILPQKMKQVLELDNIIIPKLQSELETVMEELNRLQNARRTKNIYRPKDLKEARFIDRIR